MSRKVLESERLFLKPLSFNELLYINNNEVNRIETPIELEALPDFVKSAISKKLEKMQKVNDDVHEWYTLTMQFYWIL